MTANTTRGQYNGLNLPRSSHGDTTTAGNATCEAHQLNQEMINQATPLFKRRATDLTSWRVDNTLHVA